MTVPSEIQNVTATAVANVYFDGKVISHTIVSADGARKTLGLIFPGSYHFDTEAPELMQITAGQCKVKLAGEDHWNEYSAGSEFTIPGNSSFDITVEDGMGQYICSFL